MRFGRFPKISCLFFILLVVAASAAWGGDIDDSETLGLFSNEEIVVSTSRIPRPISKIAENVAVITADDITRLNAHTLTEVLQTIPGIQVDYLRTPSTFTYFNIQGALNTTVLVLIDGIRQNDFHQNMALPGLIPVQQIERIEIIKGAASASWGSALGGVINIVTKSPDPDQSPSGMISGSTGTRFTADARAELSGTKRRVGYYLTAGHLRSDGLSPNTDTDMNNLYGKLSYALPGNGTMIFGLSYLDARPGLGETPYGESVYHDDNEYRRTNAFLKFHQPLGNKLDLDIDSYVTGRDDHTKWGNRTAQNAIVYSNDFNVRDSSRGVNASISWGDSGKNLMTGFEYAHLDASLNDLIGSNSLDYDRSWDRFALYSNGSYSFGKLTILPGLRMDRTGLVGDNLSYTLGAIYNLAENTTLRAYAAQGFSLPMLQYQNKVQKIRTIQGGVETGAVPYLWLKGTYFFNAVRDSESVGVSTVTDQNRQGFEMEVRTTPLFGLSLASGYTFLYAKDAETGERLHTDGGQTVPSHTVKLALNYDHSDLGLRGALAGNYVIWNEAADYPVKEAGIWDLHLNWKPNLQTALSPELFFSVHNLFDGVQTTNPIFYKNAGRWLEGGVRLKF